MEHRGALLGPEESGLANEPEGSGVGAVSSGSRMHGSLRIVCVWWLGPALIKPLVWVFWTGWVVSLGWILEDR